MEELIRKKDAVYAVLHNEGDAADALKHLMEQIIAAERKDDERIH